VFGQLDGVDILQNAGVDVVLVDREMRNLATALKQPIKLPQMRPADIAVSPFGSSST